jgi:hypothetical protein
VKRIAALLPCTALTSIRPHHPMPTMAARIISITFLLREVSLALAGESYDLAANFDRRQTHPAPI